MMENNTQNTVPHVEKPKNSPEITPILLGFNVILLLMATSLAFLVYGRIHTHIQKTPTTAVAPVTQNHAFDTVSLQGKAAYVYDVSADKVLFQKNAEVQLPLASLTKLMTALTAIQLVPKDSHITIRKEFLQEEGDSGLINGESWKLSDLLDFSLVVSSNDGARSVASVIGAMDLKSTDYTLGRKDFIEKMNVTAQKIGLTHTYFINESGLDEANTSGGYGSAEDMEKMMQYILKNQPTLLEATKYPTTQVSSLSHTHTAVNTDVSISQIPNLLASKTGYTTLAGGNLAVAFDGSIGHPIIVVVLGSTQSGRFTDVETLVKASMTYMDDQSSK